MSPTNSVPLVPVIPVPVRPRSRGAWLALLLCLPAVHGLAEETAAGREAMADAMSRMMSAMGMMGQSAAAAQGAGVPGGSALEQAGETGRRLMEDAIRTVPAGGLDGLWEASGSGLLIVEGGRYRLYAPYGGFVDGDLEIVGQRVRMSSRRAGFNLDFEYALDQGRLALRDARGQVYLYRRLTLPGGG